MVAPQWLYRFNNARSPLAARNALGLAESDAVAFAALPARPTMGQRAFVTDATVSAFGSTVSAGGGTGKLPVYYDGTNWIVG